MNKHMKCTSLREFDYFRQKHLEQLLRNRIVQVSGLDIFSDLDDSVNSYSANNVLRAFALIYTLKIPSATLRPTAILRTTQLIINLIAYERNLKERDSMLISAVEFICNLHTLCSHL